jgi:hypothetical protein
MRSRKSGVLRNRELCFGSGSGDRAAVEETVRRLSTFPTELRILRMLGTTLGTEHVSSQCFRPCEPNLAERLNLSERISPCLCNGKRYLHSVRQANPRVAEKARLDAGVLRRSHRFGKCLHLAAGAREKGASPKND